MHHHHQVKRQRRVVTTVRRDGEEFKQVEEGIDLGDIGASDLDDDDDEGVRRGITDFSAPPPPAPLELVPFSKISSELNVPEQPCWGCIWNFSKPRVAGVDKEMDAIWQEFASNKDTMNLRDLAQLLHDFHDQFIYRPHTRNKKECIPWPFEVVLRHLQYHMIDLDFEYLDTLKNLKMVERKILDTVLVKHGDEGAVDVRDKPIDSLTKIVNTKLKVLAVLQARRKV